MNYKEIYDSICARGKCLRENLEYTERHHIVPKCMGGDDSVLNITTLTAKEHYLVHYLLVKLYPNNYKILHAFGMMCKSNRNVKRNYTSRQYSIMRLSTSKAMKLWNPMFNDEYKRKAIKTRTERYNSGELTPRKLSENEKLDISERMKCDNNPTRKYPENIILKITNMFWVNYVTIMG